MKITTIEFIEVTLHRDTPLLELLISRKEREYINKNVSNSKKHFVSLREISERSNNLILVEALTIYNIKK